MEKEITKLFKTRDEAVLKQDSKLFQSTQLPDIEYSSVQGYLAIDNLKTEVLFSHKDSPSVRLILVKEIYKPEGKPAYSAYVLYSVVHTEKGWLVYKIR